MCSSAHRFSMMGEAHNVRKNAYLPPPKTKKKLANHVNQSSLFPKIYMWPKKTLKGSPCSSSGFCGNASWRHKKWQHQIEGWLLRCPGPKTLCRKQLFNQISKNQLCKCEAGNKTPYSMELTDHCWSLKWLTCGKLQQSHWHSSTYWRSPCDARGAFF